jgi:hypothetical protein
MRTIFNLAVYSLLISILFSACSRPYATYQKMPVEHFASRTKAPVAQPAPVSEQAPAVVTTAPVTESAVDQATPLTTAASLTKVNEQLQEAMASTDAKLAGNKKLEKRMARVQRMLAEASTKAAAAPVATNSTRKMNLAERMMLKKIDKKIKNSVAPEDAKVMSRTLRAGIIIGVVGLLFALLFGNVLGLLGVLMLIAGVVLILVDVLSTT